MTMIRQSIAVALATFMLAAPAMAQTGAGSTFQPSPEDPEAYPDFPGRDITFGFCAACHGFRIVAAQGMTRPQWDASLRWMTQRHNMPELEAADRDTILEYLAAAFPPKTAAGGRANWQSPFAAKP